IAGDEVTGERIAQLVAQAFRRGRHIRPSTAGCPRFKRRRQEYVPLVRHSAVLSRRLRPHPLSSPRCREPAAVVGAPTRLRLSNLGWPWDPNDQRTQEDTPMTKLHGQVAVITGATAGMALAAAKLFVTEGAHVYITGRRKDQLDDAVSEIGGNVTGVRSDSGNPRDLDLLVDAVRAGHGRV